MNEIIERYTKERVVKFFDLFKDSKDIKKALRKPYLLPKEHYVLFEMIWKNIKNKSNLKKFFYLAGLKDLYDKDNIKFWEEFEKLDVFIYPSPESTLNELSKDKENQNKHHVYGKLITEKNEDTYFFLNNFYKDQLNFYKNKKKKNAFNIMFDIVSLVFVAGLFIFNPAKLGMAILCFSLSIITVMIILGLLSKIENLKFNEKQSGLLKKKIEDLSESNVYELVNKYWVSDYLFKFKNNPIHPAFLEHS